MYSFLLVLLLCYWRRRRRKRAVGEAAGTKRSHTCMCKCVCVCVFGSGRLLALRALTYYVFMSLGIHLNGRVTYVVMIHLILLAKNSGGEGSETKKKNKIETKKNNIQ